MRITNQPVAPSKGKTADEESNSKYKTMDKRISTACSNKAEAVLRECGAPTSTHLQQPEDTSIG